MRISDTSNICVYLVEGDDDEAALTQQCDLKRPDVPLVQSSKILNIIEGHLGKYLRLIRRGRSPIKKYVDGQTIVLVVKFAQGASHRQIANFLKEKRDKLSEYVQCIFLIFDCDAPAEQCRKFNDVSSLLECEEYRPCCSMSARYGLCYKIRILALAPKLENTPLCNCICCSKC